MLRQPERDAERRVKARFSIHRELRYKLLEGDTIVESGIGETIDMASSGVAFQIDHPLRAGAIIELAISWPVLLEDACPMRLIVFGRVVRNWDRKSACKVDRYEFRTQARTLHAIATVRHDGRLQRFAGTVRKEAAKAAGY